MWCGNDLHEEGLIYNVQCQINAMSAFVKPRKHRQDSEAPLCKKTTNQLHRVLKIHSKRSALPIIHDQHVFRGDYPDSELYMQKRSNSEMCFVQDGVDISAHKDLFQRTRATGDLVHIALQDETLFISQVEKTNEPEGCADIT